MKLFFMIIVLFWCNIMVTAQNDWLIVKTDITEHLHDIEFINDSVGFIYSYGTGNIYRTSDEGNSWKIVKKTDSVYLEQMQFVNCTQGWICGEKGKVLATNTGGTTWSDISITIKNKNLLLYGMCFLSDSMGYLSGAFLRDNKMTPVVYLTNNGGISWTEVYKDIPHMILNLEESGDKILATGRGFIINIDIKTNSWKYLFRDTLGVVGQIRDIHFVDKNSGIAISFNGKVLKTTDGGNTFSCLQITSNRLRSIACFGAGRWIVGGDNNNNDGAVLYYSADNGITWIKSNKFPDIHRIALTDKYIWIVGKDGLIAKHLKKKKLFKL